MENYAQRSVRHCLDMIAPFEASDLRAEKAQLQFYKLMTSIYQGMYAAPEKYLVFSAPYERYMEKREEKGWKKEKEHVTDSRESTLRNTVQQAIQFYALYFYYLGIRSSIDEASGALILSEKSYSEVLDEMNCIHESNYNAERYTRLSHLGIQVYKTEGKVHIVHILMPCVDCTVCVVCRRANANG